MIEIQTDGLPPGIARRIIYWRKFHWQLYQEWHINGRHWWQLVGARVVDYPVYYAPPIGSGLIVYDFPERIPKYVKRIIERIIRANHG